MSWSPSSALTSAATTLSASTAWTAQTVSQSSRTSASSPDNPPNTPFDVPTGVQYALETYRGGFLVTDGHHNRVLRVTLDGEVTELIAFDNIVPTGLAVSRYLVYMAKAGPVPHLPAGRQGGGVRAEVAHRHGGGLRRPPPRRRGIWPRSHVSTRSHRATFRSGDPEGSPAEPNTGALVKVNRDGTFTVVTNGLNQPTSLEFIRNTAYVVTLAGEIWKIKGIPDGNDDSDFDGEDDEDEDDD